MRCLRILVPRPGLNRYRCIHPLLDGTKFLCVPSFYLDTSFSEEASGRRSDRHTSGTLVAVTGLVSALLSASPFGTADSPS